MDAAIVIGGGFVVVLVICAVMGRKAWARFGKLEVSIGSIDAAVNHRKPGQPPLGQQVDRAVEELSALRRESTQRLDVVDRRLDTVDRRQENCEDGLKAIAERLK